MLLSVLVAYIAFAIITLLLMVFAGILAKKRNNGEYKLKSYFPFELFELNGKPLVWPRVFEILNVVAPLSYFAYIMNVLATRNMAYYTYEIILSIVMVVSSASYLLLTVIKPKNFRSFIGLYLSLLASVSLEAIVFGLFVSKESQFNATNSLGDVFFIIFIVMAFLNVLSLADPGLRRWDKLDQEIDNDGTLHYVRPKVLNLALHEWILIFTKNLLEIMFAIFVFVL